MPLTFSSMLDQASLDAEGAPQTPANGTEACCKPYTLEIGVFFDGTFNYGEFDLTQEEADSFWQQNAYEEKWRAMEKEARQKEADFLEAERQAEALRQRLMARERRIRELAAKPREAAHNPGAMAAEQAALERESEELRAAIFATGQKKEEAAAARKAADQARKDLEKAKQKREAGKERGTLRELDSPGETSTTNVYKLYNLYPRDLTRTPSTIDGKNILRTRFYYRGVGVVLGKESTDDYSGYSGGTGMGEEGGRARIAEARKEIREYLKSLNPCMPASVRIDVFGFSRGAALARHFVNALQDGLPDMTQQAAPADTGMKTYGELRWDMMPVPPVNLSAPGLPATVTGTKRPPLPDVQVRFVGLFDTVGSFGLPGNAYEWDFKLHLPPGCALQVYQIVARHERRANFRFTSVLPGWTEDYMDGVHADIGGGYKLSEHCFLLMDREFYHHMSPGGQAQAAKNLLLRARSRGIGDGESLPPGWIIAADAWAEANTALPQGLDRAVLLRAKITSNSLAEKALKAMHMRAIASGVPLLALVDSPSFPPAPAGISPLGNSRWETGIHVSAICNDLEIPYARQPRGRYKMPPSLGMELDSGFCRNGFPNAPDGMRGATPYGQSANAGYDYEGNR